MVMANRLPQGDKVGSLCQIQRNSRSMEHLKVIHKTRKIKEENVGEYLCDFRNRKDF